jgi:hypothetical protein
LDGRGGIKLSFTVIEVEKRGIKKRQQPGSQVNLSYVLGGKVGKHAMKICL